MNREELRDKILDVLNNSQPCITCDRPSRDCSECNCQAYAIATMPELQPLFQQPQDRPDKSGYWWFEGNIAGYDGILKTMTNVWKTSSGQFRINTMRLGCGYSIDQLDGNWIYIPVPEGV